MVGKSHCGSPVPIINPPDFGWAVRLAQTAGQQPVPIPYPLDPGVVFPRVLTTSSSSRQGTSLGCEPAGACAWDVRGPRVRGGLAGSSYASYGSAGLDYAASQIAQLLARLLVPVPGIWLGPVYIEMPSGNLVLELAVPPCGPLDPIPIFTYNSQAAKSNAGRGYGIAELFNPTIERLDSDANIITGSGKQIFYRDLSASSWASAPSSARNGLFLNSDGSYIERQPDGLRWLYDAAGTAYRIESPSGSVWDIERNSDCLISTISGPGGRSTTISGTGGTFVITQPGSRVTTFQLDGGKRLVQVEYADGSSIALGYGAKNLLTSLTDGAGHATAITYDSADRVKTLVLGGNRST